MWQMRVTSRRQISQLMCFCPPIDFSFCRIVRKRDCESPLRPLSAIMKRTEQRELSPSADEWCRSLALHCLSSALAGITDLDGLAAQRQATCPRAHKFQRIGTQYPRLLDCPLPGIGELLQVEGARWVCVHCSARNSSSTRKCRCGYRELLVSPHFLHSAWLEAVKHTSDRLYWNCECGFQRNCKNTEKCVMCKKVSLAQSSELRQKRLKKAAENCVHM